MYRESLRAFAECSRRYQNTTGRYSRCVANRLLPVQSLRAAIHTVCATGRRSPFVRASRLGPVLSSHEADLTLISGRLANLLADLLVQSSSLDVYQRQVSERAVPAMQVIPALYLLEDRDSGFSVLYPARTTSDASIVSTCRSPTSLNSQ